MATMEMSMVRMNMDQTSMGQITDLMNMETTVQIKHWVEI